jgi:hypothetical protein
MRLPRIHERVRHTLAAKRKSRLLICIAMLVYACITCSWNVRKVLVYQDNITRSGDEFVFRTDPLDPAFTSAFAGFQPAKNATRPSTPYEDLPISDYRPTGQFVTDADNIKDRRALITILTATYNPRPCIFRTARFVLEQSLQSFEWVIVNDYSDEESSIDRLSELRKLAKRDLRVRVIDNPGRRGIIAAKNFGVEQVRTPYVAILDDDDMWELTALEKAVLIFSWVPDAYAVGFNVVNHGAREFIWDRGFYNGDENYHSENFIAQGSPLRSTVFKSCRFDVKFSTGAEDWDFWLCMASHGMWGLHVPENETWYQNNPRSFRHTRWKALTSSSTLADTHERIKRKYAGALAGDKSWPTVLPPSLLNPSEVAWGPLPFENRVRAPASAADHRSVLIIVDRIYRAPAPVEIFRYVQELASQRWRVTVLETHYHAENDGMRRAFRQYTHDMFVAPLVAPIGHIPRLVNYLVDSRRVRLVIVVAGSATVGYAMLPALRQSAPNVTLVDYVHDGNATGDAQRSIDMDRYLDFTVVPTVETYLQLVEVGKPASKTVVSNCVSNPASGSSQTRWRVANGTTDEYVLPPAISIDANELMSGGRVACTLPKELMQHLQQPGRPKTDGDEWRTRAHGVVNEVAINALVQALVNEATHHPSLADMRSIQLNMQYRKSRTGYGRELQRKCPERVYHNTNWFDSLDEGRLCNRHHPVDLERLRASALTQCGAWCIRAPNASRFGDTWAGYSFNGMCWSATHRDGSDPCAVA